jgi:TonB family protein
MNAQNSSDLNQCDISALIDQLDKLAQQDPAGYRRRVALLALLGYAYVFAISIGLLLLAVLFMYLLFYWHNLALVKFSFLLIIAVLVIFKSMWVKFNPPTGIPLLRDKVPKLFEMVDKIHKVSGAPVIHEVLLIDKFNCAVVQHPRLGLLGFHRNVLILGLPLLESLSVPEFEAVLAHEMGHLSSMHGRIGCWVHQVRASWIQIYINLSKQGSVGNWPIKRFADWFIPYFDMHTLALRRAHEFAADQISADIAGAGVATAALISSKVKASYLEEEFWKSVFKQSEVTPEPPTNVYSSLASAVRASISQKAALDLLESNWQKHDQMDSHPSLLERVMALQPDRDWSALSLLAEEVAKQGPLRDSAAEVLLDGMHAELSEQLSDDWRRSLSPIWHTKHLQFAEHKERFEQLQKIFEQAPLTPEQAGEFASLCISQKEPKEAIAIATRIEASYPEQAEVQYWLGLSLIGSDSDEGIQHLEKAAKFRPSYARDCNAIIAAYLHSKGRQTEAQEYAKRSEEFANLMKAASSALTQFSSGDTYRQHNLTASRLRAICDLLHADRRVKQAYLVRRKIPEILGEDQHVMVLKLGSPHWYLVDDNYLQQAINELIVLPEFSGFCLIAWGGLKQNLADACIKLPEALLYDRVSWAKSPDAQKRVNLILKSRQAAIPRRTFLQRNRGTLIGAGLLLAFIAWGVNTKIPPTKHNYRAVRYTDYDSYMKAVQSAIKGDWNPPRLAQSTRVVLSFKISRDGGVSSIGVVRSSGNDAMDRAGINAVASAAPFPPLPPGQEKSVDIEFTLDYNVQGELNQ